MNKTWSIDAEGVLTIRQGFRRRNRKPDFYARREDIRAIVVEEGVSEIGDGWFGYLNQVRQIALPSTQIRILEIYASEEAYQLHLKTDHFQKYKQGTLHMVKSLRLPTMQPLDPATMRLIFRKQQQTVKTMRFLTTIVALLMAAASINAQDNMKANVDFNVWPKGELNSAYAKYFIGNSYLAPLGGENGLVNVTFEPRCRNNWHIHHKSVQVLICVAGYGWYVEEGKEPVVLRPGTVVAIPAEAKHWHGAAKDSWMQHLTYMTKVEEGASNEWLEPVADAEYDKLPASGAQLSLTDPDYSQRFEAFAFGEVVEQVKARLDDHTRYIGYLATLVGCQGIDEYRLLLPEALDKGVTPVEAKEIVYQATAYLGMGRVRPFLTATNEVLTARGIALPLASQQTTTMDNRREAGTEAQVGCFGDSMRDFWKSGPEDSRHINLWLADNCFGDYYTRTGLDLKMRELITFCFLAAQGGCEPQLKGHIAGNLHVGNDKELLIAVVSANLPLIGYPRTLNALSCIRSVKEEE